MSVLRNIIEDNKFRPEDLPTFEAELFFEGAKRRVNLERFVVLLFLSTFIATCGVFGDSAATVIGAMLIAPLMRPIMGTAAGLVMGDIKRAGSSLLIVLLSVAGVIGLAWLLTELSVVGIALAEGEFFSAGGAFLLFLTNFLSILLAGGGVLALLGLSAVAFKGKGSNARRMAFMVVAIGIVLVSIPLGVTTSSIYSQKLIKRETINLAEEWVDGTGYGINRVDVTGNLVTLAIYGSGNRPSLSEFGDK